jgi:hypothetical protein
MPDTTQTDVGNVTVKPDAGKTEAGTLAQSASNAAGDIAQQARSAFADVKDMGTDLVTSAREGANSLFEEQRNRAANEIASLGKALRSSAQTLDGSPPTTVARYADQAAGSISDFAEALRNRSASEVAEDVENFARQWPMVFLASAVGLGFVASRFLMSSGSRSPAARSTPAAPLRPGSDADQPRNTVRHDYGAASGPVSGEAKSGYGAPIGGPGGEHP